jgi:hypothetical protein
MKSFPCFSYHGWLIFVCAVSFRLFIANQDSAEAHAHYHASRSQSTSCQNGFTWIPDIIHPERELNQAPMWMNVAQR